MGSGSLRSLFPPIGAMNDGQTDLVRRLAPADNNESADKSQGTDQQPSRRRSLEEFAFDAPQFSLPLAAATLGLIMAVTLSNISFDIWLITRSFIN